MGYLVKLSKASSPSGSAFIGPSAWSGFKVEKQDHAHVFDDVIDAEACRDHFQNKWRGFHGFSPLDITVEVVA